MTTDLRLACRAVVAGLDGQGSLDAALVRLRAAFAECEEHDGFAPVIWSVDDVLSRRPDCTDERARAWLVENGRWIQDAMVETGWAAMDDLLLND